MIQYYQGAELPALSLWLTDEDDDLIDFSSGYTFSFKVGSTGSTALLTKTTGITGAAGAGEEPDGTPNVTVAWSAGELAIAPGTHEWTLTATSGGLDRIFGGQFRVVGVIS